ncbi:N-acetylglucosamine-6-phosphate deacetylase [Sphingobium algorifonticola]|uniref:N-acetylglucosamine-6-phosphate deacetylase n=1 Tax=Sphingobium algorifonticola TaxID=2008318 RepID=A0A437JAC7_9SPHN|nr:N-acetylglucosamine-6-phosphate deacetylase [Sphingobium algorifonticola]RVT42320.1 N-acetylglucosamine-6-phosphate deacetylase [Sphingobium algorifonticola]
MTRRIFTGAAIVTEAGSREGHALVVEAGHVASVVPDIDVDGNGEVVSLGGGTIVPGFIDLQVNGGGGVLFNDEPTVEGIAQIAAAHRRFGTTGFLPTLISDDRGKIAKAIDAVERAIAMRIPGVLGIHIEGPFLNPAKRGIHDADKFDVIDAEALALLTGLKSGKTLVTLAPELAAPGVIRELSKHDIIVAAGHSMASYDDMQRARSEGMKAVTHLFNAMTQMESRAPGVVGAGLEGALTCGIIVDGHHVHPAVLRIALSAVGAEKLMLVTDAMPTVGSASKTFSLAGQTITAIDGACRAADGTLAGSDLDMATAFRNAISMMSASIVQASKMASTTPAALIGHGKIRGRLGPGMRADFVHLDDAMQVRGTWIAGASA